MIMKYFHFVVGQSGIYEAVEKDCPRADDRRREKPDGSWLPRVGESFHGAISFWTDIGLRKYHSSALCKWHLSVVTGPVEILIADSPKFFLYQDSFQIICRPGDIEIVQRMDCLSFLKEMGLKV
jgi:hypothetical protein